MKTVGYKAMAQDMTCRGYKFEVGNTYTIDNEEPLILCSDSGFHFCLNLEDVFHYYPYNNCRVFEIETYSEVLTGSDKSITKTLTIKRELTQEDFTNYKFKRKAHEVYFSGCTDEELLKFKNDENEYARKAAVEKMRDLALMFDTFKDDESFLVRIVVAKKMTDLDLMFSTFKDDKNEFVRKTVVEKMTDLDLMFETFNADKDWLVRHTVTEKMKCNNKK